jgi:hypothetical protein
MVGCKGKEEVVVACCTSTYSSLNVTRALKLAYRIKAMRIGGSEEWSINSQIGALKQPYFPGAVGTEGAIVTFDEKDNPIHGITTRAFDRKTNRPCLVREFTSAELAEASKELKEYYYTVLDAKSRRDIKTIVIFSDSFRTAVCESLLNLRHDTDYYMGASLTTKNASIYRKQSGVQTLIAEEKIYYAED